MTNPSDYNKDVLQPVIRPRSLYPTHTYYGQMNDSSYQFVEPPSDAWASNFVPNNGPVNPMYSTGSGPAMWRQHRPPRFFPSPYYAAEETPLCAYDQTELSGGIGVPVATAHGTITLRLNNRMRIDLTLDRAIRVINFQNNVVMALNASGSVCAMLHPNGRVHQYGSRVEIMAIDARGNHKYAKMWYKGVSFTSENRALVYLVDSAGTRTTTDNFSDLSQDFSLGVFYTDSRHGATFASDALGAVQTAQFWRGEDGIDNWIVNGVRICQAPDGLLRVARQINKYTLRTSPSNGTASITTPYLHCTASMGTTSHLFVRRGERRMHFDGTSFIVRNAGHSAGFDEKSQLKVF